MAGKLKLSVTFYTLYFKLHNVCDIIIYIFHRDDIHRLCMSIELIHINFLSDVILMELTIMRKILILMLMRPMLRKRSTIISTS